MKTSPEFEAGLAAMVSEEISGQALRGRHETAVGPAAKQLAIVPLPPPPAMDHSRTILRAKVKPKAKKDAPAPQPELKPDPRHARPFDEKAKAAEIVRDWAAYRAEMPEVDSVVRSRRHIVSAPRMMREGDRPESLGNGPLTKQEREEMDLDIAFARATGERLGTPATTADCPPGPCWHVGCRHHAGIEVDADLVKLNHPHREIHELPETCTLRKANEVADKNGDPAEIGEPVMTVSEVGDILNLAPQSIRNAQNSGLRKLKAGLLRLIPELRER